MRQQLQRASRSAPPRALTTALVLVSVCAAGLCMLTGLILRLLARSDADGGALIPFTTAAIAFGGVALLLNGRGRPESQLITVPLAVAALGTGISVLVIGLDAGGAPASPALYAVGVIWIPGAAFVAGYLGAAVLYRSRTVFIGGAALGIVGACTTWWELMDPVAAAPLRTAVWACWLVGAFGCAVAVAVFAARHRSPERDAAIWLLAAQGSLVIAAFVAWEVGEGDRSIVAVAFVAAVMPAAVMVTAVAFLLTALTRDPDAADARAVRVAVWMLLVVGLLVVYAAIMISLSRVLPFSATTGGIVAVLALAIGAEPARRGLQRAVDQFIYGRSAMPRALSRRLGEEIAQHSAPDGIGGDPLQVLADALRRSLRLGGVVIRAVDTEGSTASSGSLRPELVRTLPLDGPNGTSGYLDVCPAHGQSLDPRVLKVLRRITGILEVALRLAETNRSLSDARQRIDQVATGEHRFVSAEIGTHIRPVLLTTQRELRTPLDDPRALTALRRAAKGLQTATAEVRDLARTLLPGALDAGDLRGALDDLAERFPQPVLSVRVDAGAQADPASYHLIAELVLRSRRRSTAEHGGIARIDARIDADGGIDLALHGAVEAMAGLRDAVSERALELGQTVRFAEDERTLRIELRPQRTAR